MEQANQLQHDEARVETNHMDSDKETLRMPKGMKQSPATFLETPTHEGIDPKRRKWESIPRRNRCEACVGVALANRNANTWGNRSQA